MSYLCKTKLIHITKPFSSNKIGKSCIAMLKSTNTQKYAWITWKLIEYETSYYIFYKLTKV